MSTVSVVERELIGVCKADLMQLHERLQQYTRQLRHCPTNIHDYHTIITLAVDELYKPPEACEPTTAAVDEGFELPMETGAGAVPMAVKLEHQTWQDGDSADVLPVSATASEAGVDYYSQTAIAVASAFEPAPAETERDDSPLAALGLPQSSHDALDPLHDNDNAIAVLPPTAAVATTSTLSSSPSLSVRLGDGSFIDRRRSAIGQLDAAAAVDTDPIATRLLKKVRLLNGRYNCPIQGCPHAATHKDNLRKHVRRVHTRSATEYKCPFCSFESSRAPSTIRKHILNRHKDHEICHRLHTIDNEVFLKYKPVS